MKSAFSKFAIAAVALGTMAFAADSATGSTQFGVTIGAEAAIVVDTANTTLAKTVSDTTFTAAYVGTTSITYKLRTTASGGTGKIQARVSSVFNETTSGIQTGDIYFTSSSGSGTPVSNIQAATTDKDVLTFGEDFHSAEGGTGGTINWSMADKVVFKTGTHNATVTLTISAT